MYARSESISSLAAALAASMGATGPATKDGENPHFRSKFATLASCHAACIGPLTANGLAFLMLPANAGDTAVEVTALLVHSSGEWISNSLTMPHKGDPHSIASGISYARRYLYSMVGVVADDDDDGNAAMGRPSPAPVAAPARPVAPPVAPPAPKVEPSRPVVLAKPVAPPVAPPLAEPETDGTRTAKMDSLPSPDDGAMSDALISDLRAAFVALRFGSTGANAKCLEVCGKPRSEMTTSDGETLLMALQAELMKKGQS